MKKQVLKSDSEKQNHQNYFHQLLFKSLIGTLKHLRSDKLLLQAYLLPGLRDLEHSQKANCGKFLVKNAYQQLIRIFGVDFLSHAVEQEPLRIF